MPDSKGEWIVSPDSADVAIFVGSESAKSMAPDLLEEIEAVARRIAERPGDTEPRIRCPDVEIIQNCHSLIICRGDLG